MNRKCIYALFAIIFCGICTCEGGQLKSVKVKTRAPANREVTVYYRVPRNYDKDSGLLYRVLVIFGGRNCKGRSEAGGMLGFADWADKHDIFLVGPGFTNDEYWHPEKWSGKALQKALELIKKEYNIREDRLLYYGWSGGSQCANLFPAWRPENSVAWVSHACGVWHRPSRRMQRVAGLVTCGDADTGRYILSRHFVEESRKLGLNVMWRSFPNTPHAVPPKSVELARAFLLHYHKLNLYDLGVPGTHPYSALARMEPEFIGDDLEGRYWPASNPVAKRIKREDRVRLYTKELAEAWGERAGALYERK
jgi:hypothetical protein